MFLELMGIRTACLFKQWWIDALWQPQNSLNYSKWFARIAISNWILIRKVKNKGFSSWLLAMFWRKNAIWRLSKFLTKNTPTEILHWYWSTELTAQETPTNWPSKVGTYNIYDIAKNGQIYGATKSRRQTIPIMAQTSVDKLYQNIGQTSWFCWLLEFKILESVCSVTNWQTSSLNSNLLKLTSI